MLATALSILPAAAQDLSGAVRMIDADTLDLGDVRVRLHGIDAPELGQLCGAPAGGAWACGDWALTAARDLYDGRAARCDSLDRDRYGRVVARCHVAGEDMGARLVAIGAAQAYRRYSHDYVAAENKARVLGTGLWAGDMVAPEKARRITGAPDPAPEGCAIKGNLSGNGRIYHLPGQDFYDRTTIREGRGERWFCSEAEARAAGWRRALR